MHKETALKKIQFHCTDFLVVIGAQILTYSFVFKNSAAVNIKIRPASHIKATYASEANELVSLHLQHS